MLMYPYTLKQTLAMGLPGRISPMTYSDSTLSPGVWFVVAVMTLMGSVNTKAMAQAKRSPHQGSCTSFLSTVQRTSETAVDSASSEWNHQPGASSYLVISLVCTSGLSFFSFREARNRR